MTKTCCDRPAVKTLTTDTGMVYACQSCSRHWFRTYENAAGMFAEQERCPPDEQATLRANAINELGSDNEHQVAGPTPEPGSVASFPALPIDPAADAVVDKLVADRLAGCNPTRPIIHCFWETSRVCPPGCGGSQHCAIRAECGHEIRQIFDTYPPHTVCTACGKSFPYEEQEPESSQLEWIDPDDAPELTDEAMDRAIYKIAGKVVTREEWIVAAKRELIRAGAATVPILPTGPLTPELLAECKRRCEEVGLRFVEPGACTCPVPSSKPNDSHLAGCPALRT